MRALANRIGIDVDNFLSLDRMAREYIDYIKL